MTRDQFKKRLAALKKGHERLIARPNKPVREGNGVFSRYVNPVLTAAHTPIFWRYDFSQETKGPTASPFSPSRNPAPGPRGSGSGIIRR